MNDLSEALNAAFKSGKLLTSSKANIDSLLAGAASDLPKYAVSELLAENNYSELNDRFFKTLAFGTGGLRGRTIGRMIAACEQGAGGPNGRPEFPCVGTATMNYYNLSRAVRGLIAYVKAFVGEREQKRPLYLLTIRVISRKTSRITAPRFVRITAAMPMCSMAHVRLLSCRLRFASSARIQAW